MSFSVDLSGRIALITGASSGLGRHFAKVLAKAGASVAIAARRIDALETLRASIEEKGGRAFPVVMDVTSRASVDDAIAAVSAEFGRIDVLVNNAGVASTRTALDLDEAGWDFVLDTNLKGSFLVAQSAARTMKERGGGTIVNIASILGERVAGAVAPYAASKAGLVQLTRALALEWARHGIRVNALCPGYIGTDINAEFFASEAGQSMIRRIPMRRLGRPEDLDGALLLLASDGSAWMTGSVLTVDGGHLVSSL